MSVGVFVGASWAQWPACGGDVESSTVALAVDLVTETRELSGNLSSNPSIGDIPRIRPAEDI